MQWLWCYECDTRQEAYPGDECDVCGADLVAPPPAECELDDDEDR